MSSIQTKLVMTEEMVNLNDDDDDDKLIYSSLDLI